MDWNTELTLILRTTIASLLGALIGMEREFIGKKAGIRTYAAVELADAGIAMGGLGSDATIETADV